MDNIKRRIIINILDENISDKDTMLMVGKVIEMGKVSEIKGKKQYCFVSGFGNGNIVYAKQKYNTNSDIFYVYKKER